MAQPRVSFIRNQRSGRYVGVIMLGNLGATWKCQHQHRSIDEAYACATVERADQLMDDYEFFQSQDDDEEVA